MVCTLFQSHITTRSEIKAKIRFCIYTICHITIELTVYCILHRCASVDEWLTQTVDVLKYKLCIEILRKITQQTIN